MKKIENKFTQYYGRGSRIIKVFDTKKLTSTPRDVFEAMGALIKKEQELLTALFIMKGLVDYPEEEHKEIHKKKINEFLSKYYLHPITPNK